MRFKDFFKEDKNAEGMEDIQKTISKLPQSHAALVSGFQMKFHPGNTLNGDKNHVGYVDDNSKEIAVAAPWNFSREFTILHEIAHKVWEKFVAPNQRLAQLWTQLVQKNSSDQMQRNPQAKDSLDQEPEEIFCHSYANFYSKHKNATYNNPEWMHFIKNIS